MRRLLVLVLPILASAPALATEERVGSWIFNGPSGETVIVSARTDPANGFGLSLGCIGGGPGSTRLAFIAPSDMGSASRNNDRSVSYRTGDGPQGRIIASYAGSSAVVYRLATDRDGPGLVRELAGGGPLAVELRGTNGVAQSGTIAIGGAGEVLAKVAAACNDDTLAALLAPQG